MSNKDLPCLKGGNIFQRQIAHAFRGSPLAKAQQARQTPISGAVFRVAQEVRGIAQDKAHANDQTHVGLFCCHMHTHHAGKSVAVGHANRLPDQDALPFPPARQGEMHRAEKKNLSSPQGRHMCGAWSFLISVICLWAAQCARCPSFPYAGWASSRTAPRDDPLEPIFKLGMKGARPFLPAA